MWSSWRSRCWQQRPRSRCGEEENCNHPTNLCPPQRSPRGQNMHLAPMRSGVYHTFPHSRFVSTNCSIQQRRSCLIISPTCIVYATYLGTSGECPRPAMRGECDARWCHNRFGKRWTKSLRSTHQRDIPLAYPPRIMCPASCHFWAIPLLGWMRKRKHCERTYDLRPGSVQSSASLVIVAGCFV